MSVLFPRYQDINDEEPTDSAATTIAVNRVNGIIVPVKVKASWLPEEGEFTWYIFEVSHIRYYL